MSSPQPEQSVQLEAPVVEQPRIDAVLDPKSKSAEATAETGLAEAVGGAETVTEATKEASVDSQEAPEVDRPILGNKPPKRPAEEVASKSDNKRVKGSLDGYFTKKASSPAEGLTASSSTAGPSGSPAKVSSEDLEGTTLGIDWRKALQAEFDKPYFVKLRAFIKSEFKSQTVYPIAKDVYSWSRLTRLDSVKVVILGQDPYHGPGQAHGLSFSVKDPVPPPPSLRNIYKQLADDIPGFVIPKSGDLSGTARQGVLWLNSSLTVRSGQAASHSGKGWETFTAAVLKAVVNRKLARGVVFLCWGAHASKVVKGLNIDKNRHLVLDSAHPSPLSAHKGFLGNQHFKKTNDWLRKTYGEGEEIDWTVLNPKA